MKLLNTSHCSPPPSSLSPPQPALFAEVRTLPIFQHFSSKSLSFNMADLGRVEKGLYTTGVDRQNLDNPSDHLIRFECVVSRARNSVVERSIACAP